MLKVPRGFTLIELIIGVAILGVLLALAVPGFANWLRNLKVRTAAESVQNGLQLARVEAVRRNTAVGFYLVDTLTDACALDDSGPNWVVSLSEPKDKCGTAPSETVEPRIVQVRSMAEGSAQATLAAADAASQAQTTIVFNGMGRRTTPAAAAGNVSIDFGSASGDACIAGGGPVRCLRVVVTVGGQIRMCDPALTAGDAQACA